MIKRIENGVRIYPGGREVCQNTAAGKREYARRREVAWALQGGFCGRCARPIAPQDATLDHIQPRGMGGSRRDDRMENLQMLCFLCNLWKGSKRDA